MDGRPPSSRARVRRGGGVLLELLLAIAMFAAAAAFTTSAMRSAIDGVRRAELRARAFDLAATRLAELDAGLVASGDLGDDRPRADGLAVRLEFLPGEGGRLARARATVTDYSGVTDGGDPTIVAVHERTVRQREVAGGKQP